VRGRNVLFQIVISLLLTSASNALAEVIYVDASKQTGWKNAHVSLHDALKSTKTGDEIWVAKGTYKTMGKSFQMVEGVEVIGGFSGNERSKNNSDPERNATILDGDGGGIFTDDTASQFGKTAPVISSCDFVENFAANYGGGISNYNKCSPAIELSTFAKNEAKSGGAISNRLGVTAQITQCEFLATTDTVKSSK
jgi:hypothetical protein